MTEHTMNEIATQLAKALEARNYDKFVAYFAEEAVFEIPFSIEGGTTLTGLPMIKAHFDNVSKSPASKLVQIDNVTAKTYYDETAQVATIQYFTKGKTQASQIEFNIQTSIALIKFEGQHIIHYKDFPNTIGIAKVAGILPQLLASWAK